MPSIIIHILQKSSIIFTFCETLFSKGKINATIISHFAKCGDVMELGKRVKYLREAAGLTQLEFAKTMNISNSALSQYESGSRIPSDELKAKIADYFGVTLDYLYGRTDLKAGPSAPSPKDIQAAFWGGEKDLTQEDLDAMWADVENFAAFVAQKRRQKKKND